MTECHEASIKFMNMELGKLAHRKLGRALDVASGDGRLTEDILVKSYGAVDLFDLCTKAVTVLCHLFVDTSQVKRIECSSMESYEFRDIYDGIFLRWCVGYLEDADLKAFLKRAKQYLNNPDRRFTRYSQPSAYVFVMDNVAEPGEKCEKVKGQRIRDMDSLETIFYDAGFQVHTRSELTLLNDDYRSVMMWALY